MDNSDGFNSYLTKKKYKINFVAYLFDFVVYGFQYIGCTSTPFRYRFNNYKECYCKYSSGFSVPRVDLLRHFSEYSMKKWQHYFDILKAFSSNIYQSMKCQIVTKRFTETYS